MIEAYAIISLYYRFLRRTYHKGTCLDDYSRGCSMDLEVSADGLVTFRRFKIEGIEVTNGGEQRHVRELHARMEFNLPLPEAVYWDIRDHPNFGGY